MERPSISQLVIHYIFPDAYLFVDNILPVDGGKELVVRDFFGVLSPTSKPETNTYNPFVGSFK